MVERYFLGLDLPNDEIIPVGQEVLEFLERRYGEGFLAEKTGVKINDRDLRGGHGKFSVFKDEGCKVFGDIKICHGYNTGYPIIETVGRELPLDYVTVAATMGQKTVTKYVERAKEDGVKIIGFTVHTKTPESEAKEMYRQSVDDAIYTLGKMASDSGCDAMVLDGPRLEDERIRELPLKKLVTGMRIDPGDKGAQARVTSLEQLKGVKDDVHYLVISERYLRNFDKIAQIIESFE